MIYKDFQGEKLSLLGFGAMRLPVLDGQQDKIDEKQVFDMVEYAINHGVNYFDTAYPYHAGYSELVIGKALKDYNRDLWNLATKYPGHQLSDSYDPKDIFELQLKKCQVDHFDYYLLHNVSENSMGVYENPKWGIMEYFLEQKKQGRIRHLGFSSHALYSLFEGFLERNAENFEFCQIQFNYLDYSLQKAEQKVKLLEKYNIPVWVMEPIRGGKLATLPDEQMALLKEKRPGMSAAAWALRYVQGFSNIHMILSGMSTLEQMKQNVETFEKEDPLSSDEIKVLYDIADTMKNSVPCTSCRYCCEGCPQQLNIPYLLEVYNDMRCSTQVNATMQIEFLPDEKQPSACIGCQKCEETCPQHIQVSNIMKELAEMIKDAPKWADMCRQRAAEAERLRERL